MAVTDNNFVSARPGSALGFAATQFNKVEPFRATFAAGSGVDIPGPAAGYVRVFDSVNLTPTVPAAPLSAATVLALNPGARTFGTCAGAFDQRTLTFRTPVFGFGESLRVTNGSANAGIVAGTYVDVSARWIVLVRGTLTNVLEAVIPPAPAGFYHRFLQVGEMVSGLGRRMSYKIVVYNADSVAHTLEYALGGDVISRYVSEAAGAQLSTREPAMNWPVTALPLQARVVEAITTTAVNFLATYEVLPL